MLAEVCTHLKNPMKHVKITIDHFSFFVNLEPSSGCAITSDSLAGSELLPFSSLVMSDCSVGDVLRSAMAQKTLGVELGRQGRGVHLIYCSKGQTKSPCEKDKAKIISDASRLGGGTHAVRCGPVIQPHPLAELSAPLS